MRPSSRAHVDWPPHAFTSLLVARAGMLCGLSAALFHLVNPGGAAPDLTDVAAAAAAVALTATFSVLVHAAAANALSGLKLAPLTLPFNIVAWARPPSSSERAHAARANGRTRGRREPASLPGHALVTARGRAPSAQDVRRASARGWCAA